MKRCPHCGAQDNEDAILCKSCFRSFAAPVTPRADKVAKKREPPKREKKSSPLFALVRLVILGGLLAYFGLPQVVRDMISRVVEQQEEVAPEAAPAETTPVSEPPAQRPTDAAPAPALPPDPAPTNGTPPAAQSDSRAPAGGPGGGGTVRPVSRTAKPAPSTAPPPEPPPSRLPERPMEQAPSEPPPPAKTAQAERAARPASEPIRVGGNIKPPLKTRDVPPAYPPMARQARVQGIVIIEAIISPAGRVQQARVLRSIPLLDEAALDAVKQWEFEPTVLNGVPVPVIMTVTVRFSLQ
jgi:protein TonB